MLLEQLRARVIKSAQNCDRAGLTIGTQGNYSARDKETGLVCITPTNYPYESMKPEDIVVVKDDMTLVEGARKPSSDTDVHTFIYRSRPDVMGICHTHARYSNVFGAVGKDIMPVLGTGQQLAGGVVKVLPFTHFGTEEGQQSVVDALKDRRAVVLGGHGLTCIGPSIEVATMVNQMVEENAHVYWMALQIGQPIRVPEKITRI